MGFTYSPYEILSLRADKVTGGTQKRVHDVCFKTAAVKIIQSKKKGKINRVYTYTFVR